MAIFGIGAYYDWDVSSDFLEQGCACIGWPEKDAPPAHGILRHLRAGDIIFIKSFTPNDGLTIKAVGLVKEGKVHSFSSLGNGVLVRWVWNGEEKIGRLDDKWPCGPLQYMRNTTRKYKIALWTCYLAINNGHPLGERSQPDVRNRN